MLKLQEYLRSGKTPEQLKEELAINFKTHSKYQNLYLFKYSQIDSPKNHEIVIECRGTILDKDNNWDIVSRPYQRFFNYGEGHAADIDWNTAKCLEKLDGTCIQMYFYDGKWQAGTLGMPDAAGEVNGLSNKSFSELFWDTFNELGYKLPEAIEYTYLFELMTPYNRVVVRHEVPRIVLHGVIENESGKNMNLTYSYFQNIFGKLYGWELVKSYPLNTLENILESANHIDPLQSEGYVIVDANGNRIKVKSPAYLALHHAVDGFSPKAFLEIIRTGEKSEVLTYFPEYTEDYNKLEKNYFSLIQDIETEFDKYKHIEVQKEFALSIKDNIYSGIMFSLKSGKVNSVKESLHKMDISKLLTMVVRHSNNDT